MFFIFLNYYDLGMLKMGISKHLKKCMQSMIKYRGTCLNFILARRNKSQKALPNY